MMKWMPMETAPLDGTVVNVVGRYPDADAGFPRYAAFRDGEWYDCNRHGDDRIIPWAWRYRDAWPHSLSDFEEAYIPNPWGFDNNKPRARPEAEGKGR